MSSFGSLGWRRFRRCLLSLLAVAAVFAASLVATVPAQAAPSVSSVRVVPGTTQVTVAWARVTGAKSYRVEVATNKSITKSRKTATAKGTTAAVPKLKKDTTYYVRVTATLKSGSVRSKVVKTRTTSASTGRGEITSVTGAGIDKIKVKWKGFAKATSLTLQISFDNEPISKAQKGKYFEVTKLPATATSAVVPVPKKFRPWIGSASGHPAYVRLVSYNGSKKSTSRIKYGWAGSFPTGEQGVRVAAYNVGNIHAPKPAPPWKSRREAIRRSVELAAPDVLLVQEASTARAPSGLKEFEDVESLLKGFALAYDAETVGTTDGGKTTKGDHIYYRTSEVRVIRAGLQSGKALTPTTWGEVGNRHFSWALLEQRDTGQRFYAVSVHLPTGTTKAVRTLRREVVRAIDEFIDRKNRNDGYPVIIGGDFNSSVMNVQDGPATELVKLGYVDAAAAPSRSGYRYSTSTPFGLSKPRSYAYTGTRIDYLMIKGGGGPSKWVNQIVLKNGTFDEKYYGSDHALQWADFTWAPSGG